MNHRTFGANAEAKAAEYLESLGWIILEKNAHLGHGEIDILADSGKEVVLIEVKAKTTLTTGYAVEMLTSAKQRTLRRLAKYVESRYNKPVRIDVITFDYIGTDQESMAHYPYAVGE
jgi:putative endonuclease